MERGDRMGSRVDNNCPWALTPGNAAMGDTASGRRSMEAVVVVDSVWSWCTVSAWEESPVEEGKNDVLMLPEGWRS